MEGMVHLDQLYIYMYFLEDVCFSWIALRPYMPEFYLWFWEIPNVWGFDHDSFISVAFNNSC